MTTESFMEKILSVIKIRAVNYRLTDNEFRILFDSVYRELGSLVVLKKIEFPTTVTKEKPYINAIEDYALVPDAGSEILLSIYELEDADTETNVTLLFDFTDDLSVELRTDCEYLDWCGFFDSYGTGATANIRVKVNVLPTVGELNSNVQEYLVPAITEGIMYNIESYIPDAVNSQIANLSYMRYYNAKKLLTSQLPQHV